MKKRSHRAFPTELYIPSQLEFVGLHFDRLGYRVQVTEFGKVTGELLEVNFGLHSLAQRSMDEGKYMSMSWDVDLANGPVGSIVLVDNSDFIDWFEGESCEVYSDMAVFHVAILTKNEWVEVICNKLPKLEWI